MLSSQSVTAAGGGSWRHGVLLLGGTAGHDSSPPPVHLIAKQAPPPSPPLLAPLHLSISETIPKIPTLEISPPPPIHEPTSQGYQLSFLFYFIYFSLVDIHYS